MLLLCVGDGFEEDRAAFTGALASMGSFVRAVREAGPTSADALEVKPFHEDMLHGFGSMFDALILAIIAVDCLSWAEP